MDNTDPTVQKRMLLSEVRDLRSKRRMTQRQVASAMEWSISKVLRVEAGDVKVSTNDLRALLREYEISDEEQERLVEMNRAAWRHEGWSVYSDVFPDEFVTYLGHENHAWIIRQCELSYFPGLLQVEEYTRSIISPDESKRIRDRRTQARLERQEVLSREDGPQLFVLLDESLLHRVVGSSQVLLLQLKHVRTLMENPRVSIRVLPFTAGAHFGLDGPFTVLEFRDSRLNPIVYLENPRPSFPDSLRDDPRETAEYLDRFFSLENSARSEVETGQLIDQRIQELESERSQSADHLDRSA